MTSDHEAQAHFLPVLITGFALLFLLLLASGFIALESMRSIESDATRMVAEQQSTIRLVDEIQSEEGTLSQVFYSLASRNNAVNRAELLRRLDAVESAIHKTTDAGLASPSAALWDNVRKAAASFIAEGRREALRADTQPSEEFFQRHQTLLAALGDLTNSNLAMQNESQARQSSRASMQMRSSLMLLAGALGIAMIGAYFTIHSVNRAFRGLSWQAAELKYLSSRVMADQEEMARRLAYEMHDHLGQTLSAVEANLVAMQHAGSLHPGRLDDCLGLLKDAVGNVREVSQLLRPSILDDFGLNASLRWLTERFSERTGIPVHADISFTGRLSGECETQLFRIAQEALTNISRHAKATEVSLRLAASAGVLRLSIADNGQGFQRMPGKPSFGLAGMRARARTVGARLKIESSPAKGVEIIVEIPIDQPNYVAQVPHPVG